MTDTNPPADRTAEARPRNQHCMNCGDNRGGPIGHETFECTWDSVTTPFRKALKPSYRITLAYLIADAQQDTHPLADAAGGTGPYIVHGCVVNSAQQLKDAVRALWKHGPQLLDRLDRYKQANTDLKAKFIATQKDLDEIRGRYGDLVSDKNDLTTENEQLSARVEELERQLATIRKHQLAAVVGAYVSSEMDDAKRDNHPLAHSLADRSRAKFRGALSVFQELLADLGEIEDDEDLEEAFVVVMAEMEIAKGLDEPTTAPDSEMDPFEAADDIHRRWGS